MPAADGGLRGLAVAIFEDARALSEEIAAEPSKIPSAEPEPPPAETMSLFGSANAAEVAAPTIAAPAVDPACRHRAWSLSAALRSRWGWTCRACRRRLQDAALPKDVHDLKAVLRALLHMA